MSALLESIGRQLSDAGVVDGVSGWTLRLGYLSPEPDRAVVLVEYSARAPETSFNFDYPRVQVRIRGGQQEYPQTSAQALLVFDTLHATSFDLDDPSPAGSVVYARALESPMLLERDEHDRPLFVFNLELGRSR